MSELKPCPFCSSDDLYILINKEKDLARAYRRFDVVITCDNCDAKGPEWSYQRRSDAVTAAIQAWNQRAGETK